MIEEQDACRFRWVLKTRHRGGRANREVEWPARSRSSRSLWLLSWVVRPGPACRSVLLRGDEKASRSSPISRRSGWGSSRSLSIASRNRVLSRRILFCGCLEAGNPSRSRSFRGLISGSCRQIRAKRREVALCETYRVEFVAIFFKFVAISCRVASNGLNPSRSLVNSSRSIPDPRRISDEDRFCRNLARLFGRGSRRSPSLSSAGRLMTSRSKAGSRRF